MASNDITVKEAVANIKDQYFNKNGDTATTRQYLIEKTPYKFTPSFIEHNGKVMSILNFYVRPSSNRNLNFQDVIDLIPISSVEGVEIHLVAKDMILKGGDKQKIIKKNTNQNRSALEDSSKHEKEKQTSDRSTDEMRKAKMEDYDDYELILDSQEPLVIYKWLLLVIGNSQEDVDEQIETINRLLDQNHEGARWDSLPAEQLSEFQNLFATIEPNIYDHTSTGSNYSGLNFSLSAGLKDPNGVPLGIDALSISGSTALFDFVESTKKQAFIATPRNSRIPLYSKKDEFTTPSMSSMLAQAAANQIMMDQHRAFHIVLNDFDYFEHDRYYAPVETEEIFDKIDVSKQSINPLEGFGSIDQVSQIYDRLIKKIVNIFNVLLDFKMDIKQQSAILGAADQFYRNQHLWSSNADKDPFSTRIVNITDPEEYPTMGMLLNEFTTLATQAQANGRENRADNLDALNSLLRQTLTAHRAVLGRTTSIETSTAPQVYYDFSKIEAQDIKQVQLLNMIDYIIYQAKPGDVIVVHGYDMILTQVAKYLVETIKAAQKNGIKFIFAFDSVQAPMTSAGKMNDMFELQQLLYTDLDTDVDWCAIGRVLPHELQLVKSALNQELGPTTEACLQTKRPDQVLIHRRRGNINNFIQLMPII